MLYVGAFAYTYVKYRKGTIYRTDEEIAAADESAQPAEGTNAA